MSTIANKDYLALLGLRELTRRAYEEQVRLGDAAEALLAPYVGAELRERRRWGSGLRDSVDDWAFSPGHSVGDTDALLESLGIERDQLTETEPTTTEEPK